MAEYIERETAYSIAKKVVDAIAHGEYHAGVFAFDIMDWIDDLPAADVRPVRMGEWEQVDDYRYPWGCTNCRKTFSVRYNFCPNCGARMEES